MIKYWVRLYTINFSFYLPFMLSSILPFIARSDLLSSWATKSLYCILIKFIGWIHFFFFIFIFVCCVDETRNGRKKENLLHAKIDLSVEAFIILQHHNLCIYLIHTYRLFHLIKNCIFFINVKYINKYILCTCVLKLLCLYMTWI